MDRLKAEKKKKRFGWKKILFVVFLLVLIPILTISIWNWRNFSSASNKLFGSSNPMDVLWPSQLKNTDDRVNILLVGSALDQPEHGGSDLTDSILVLSLDQEDKTGYMLSIPRDFYVFIPGRGQAKINEAYQVGEAQDFSELGLPRGGVGLLERVISDTFDIDIHYYAQIDFTSVREIVDALDGVTVTIESEDPQGIYDPNFRPEEGGPLELTNGTHHIDGQTALKLTRARGATGGSYGFPRSDFTRTQHQQLVLAAIKDKLTWNLMLDPRTNGPILNALADNVTTDVRLSNALPLFQLITSVPNDELQSVGLHDIDDVNLLSGYRTPTGQSALIPAAGINNYQDIRAAIDKLNR